jgi:hypothetical protein
MSEIGQKQPLTVGCFRPEADVHRLATERYRPLLAVATGGNQPDSDGRRRNSG